ncbi:unnamed protein product [Pseudo-nitzschia multistriata]|uniref:Uncharacterized protein n=1 Tax=Pseudo-nitzschia multistriata TaxID=183589 RepID=A0A448ZJU6_9STRA|nr:unnamed protein product [Pseudo-nitzschia multistriata]
MLSDPHHGDNSRPLRRPGTVATAFRTLLLVALALAGIGASSAFVARGLPARTIPAAAAVGRGMGPLCNSNNNNNNNNNDRGNADSDLLEKARRLREEASLLEDDLRASSGGSNRSKSNPTTASPERPVAPVTSIEGSVWTVSYRFSCQPPPRESEENDPNGRGAAGAKPRIFYSGKLDLLLREDGYSVPIEPDGRAGVPAGSSSSSGMEITKVWGWDRETSPEDGLEYLLFSMDVGFDGSDPDAPPPPSTDRYYLQARIETDAGGGISLKEGTITVKKDVAEKTGGMWGLFRVAGILTEFRYCGDFAARPAAR